MAQKAIVLLGSKSDIEFAEKIRTALTALSIKSELRIASAHRTTNYLLDMVSEYQKSGDEIIFITVAGLSDALSGVVAAQRAFPVVACPPDTDRLGYPKVFSSAFTPSDVPVAFLNDPQKAANFVGQVFAMTNKDLSHSILQATEQRRRRIIEEDNDLLKKAS